MKSGIITIMKFLLGWPLSFVALIFIVRIISPTIGDLGSYLLQINIFFLFLSFLCFLSYYSLRSFFWYKLLRYKNHRLSFRETAYFWSISEIKRFIPGNIWSLLGKTHAFSQHNITKKTIFSIETGKKIFVTDYDQIESLTPEIFLVTKKNKKGLLDKSGKLVLMPEYDALVLYNNKNQLSLLKDKKFGLYDLTTGKLIKPIYERNVSLLDSATLIVFKEGHYGLIDWEAKPLTAFEFSEIQPWRRNVVWVKKDFEWGLFDFTKPNYLLKHIKAFHLISDKLEEKIAMVQQENYFGILSNSRGMIIPTSFSLITNLGSEDEPLYFTAKEVEEAGIVVVIYYNKDGKLLRKQVYEDEEYAHIICPED